jgi:regulator of RNase E activity RraA
VRGVTAHAGDIIVAGQDGVVVVHPGTRGGKPMAAASGSNL